MAAKVVHVGVGIVLSEDRSRALVCLRRDNDYWGGWWEFPGGKCEPDESPADCVVRELWEEVGIDVKATESLTVIQHHYADRDRLVHLHPFICELIAGTPRAIEVVKCAWHTPAELREIRFLPANGPIIDELELFLNRRR
jgi:mutator protein MutT